MSLARAVAFTLSRRVTVLTVAVLSVVVGLLSYARLPLELLPPGYVAAQLTVWIPLSAANPVEVQETVVRPTEENLRTIPGVVRLTTFAGPNVARLNLSFSKKVDMDLAAAEVRDRVERTRVVWPREVRRYLIYRFNADTDLPVLSFGFTFDADAEDLAYLVEERVVKPLEATPGVARAEVWGLLDDQVRIYVDRGKASAAGVDLYRLTQDLEASNLDVVGGEIEDGGVRYSLKTAGRFRSLEDVRSYPVRPGLTLGQIADVRPEQAVRDFVALSRNRPAMWCMVRKESTANTVETCRLARRVVADVLRNDPRLLEAGVSFDLEDARDMGALIEEALDRLAATALEGGWLAAAVLLWFLRRVRLTLVISLAIPLSLLLATCCVAATGGTLNLLSLLGATISVGMLVDNAIVVVECIQQKRELGMSPAAAAVAGASEVALAVTLSTLTTVAAFLPLIFMSGDHDGGFFTAAVGIPLCYAVLSSLAVALVFVPLATVVLYPRGAGRAEAPWIARLRESKLTALASDVFARALRAAIRRRGVVVLGVAAGAIALTAASWEKVPKAGFGEGGGGSIEVEVQFDRNFTLNDAYRAMTVLGRHVEEKSEEYGVRDFWTFFRRNRGELDIELRDRDPRRTLEIAKKLRESLPQLPGARIQAGRKDNQGSEKSKGAYRLMGPEVAVVEEWARTAVGVAEAVPGVVRVKSDLEPAEHEIHISPDREKLRRSGVVPEALWGTVQYGIRGFALNELASGEREIPLIVMYEGGDEATLAELRDLPIFTRAGARVPMSAVADLAVTRGFSEIRREGGKTGATITVDFESADRGGDEARRRVREAFDRLPLPDGYGFADATAAETEAGQKEMRDAALLAATFVFLLMGILFESFVLPFAVLLAVPFSWMGALWMLAATGVPLDLIGYISTVLLVGVVVNNGIVLIDCAHRLRAEGRDRVDALVEAGRLRLRPILMTSLTTVLGLLPTAFAEDADAVISYRSLATAVIGGMTAATLLQLFVTPLAYLFLDDLRRRALDVVRALPLNRFRGAE
ncbi:MAG TPA: efflux RND transporter permease subunit [Planctomycetota bacterium]|nr:efflux RND transporter permease subunit [Planctomycetota bacterium]